jgi:hypothetical protein
MDFSRKRSREYPIEQNVRARDQCTTLPKLPIEAAYQSSAKSDEKIGLASCVLSDDHHRGNGIDPPNIERLEMYNLFCSFLKWLH